MSKLRDIRKEQGITQEELAYRVGVTVRYIAFLESGDRKPSIDLAFEISKVLKRSVDEIFLSEKCTDCT